MCTYKIISCAAALGLSLLSTVTYADNMEVVIKAPASGPTLIITAFENDLGRFWVNGTPTTESSTFEIANNNSLTLSLSHSGTEGSANFDILTKAGTKECRVTTIHAGFTNDVVYDLEADEKEGCTVHLDGDFGKRDVFNHHYQRANIRVSMLAAASQ